MLFCCQCTKEDEADKAEILDENVVEEEAHVGDTSEDDRQNRQSLQQSLRGYVLASIPESKPELVEDIKEEVAEEPNEAISLANIGVKESPEKLADLQEDATLEERPICCKLRPGHTVEDKMGISRALSSQDRQSIKDFLACAELPGWKLMSNMFGAKATKKSMLMQEGNPLLMIKGVSLVKARAADIFDFFASADKWYDTMKVADVMFMGGKVLEVTDAHHMVCHAQFRAPPGITNRDVCFSGLHAMLDENTAITTAFSVKRADCPPHKSEWKWVRSEILTSGYLARDSGANECELTYIVQVDPKGWLPTWVVNLVAGDQADNVTRIAKYFSKHNVRTSKSEPALKASEAKDDLQRTKTR